MAQQQSFVEIAFLAMKYFIPFLFALCFHEFAHGWVAKLRGDRTAEIMGRLTLNPLAHADPIGTVILPLLAITTKLPFFGWAKPVPVDERNLRNPKVDMFWIASAGPLSNLFLALVSSIIIGGYVHFLGYMPTDKMSGDTQIVEILLQFLTTNVFLAVFNLIPVHPLDGAKVLARFLPDRVNYQLESWAGYTNMFLFVLLFAGGLHLISGPAIFVRDIFLNIADWVAQA
jgi:Zn-dependent protease